MRSPVVTQVLRQVHGFVRGVAVLVIAALVFGVVGRIIWGVIVWAWNATGRWFPL